MGTGRELPLRLTQPTGRISSTVSMIMNILSRLPGYDASRTNSIWTNCHASDSRVDRLTALFIVFLGQHISFAFA
jgi:hypothetical protein